MVPPSVWLPSCGAGARDPPFFGPQTSRFPTASRHSSTATEDVTPPIVDVRGDDIPGWARCLRHRRSFSDCHYTHLNRLGADLCRHGCAVAVVPGDGRE